MHVLSLAAVSINDSQSTASPANPPSATEVCWDRLYHLNFLNSLQAFLVKPCLAEQLVFIKVASVLRKQSNSSNALVWPA